MSRFGDGRLHSPEPQKLTSDGQSSLQSWGHSWGKGCLGTRRDDPSKVSSAEGGRAGASQARRRGWKEPRGTSRTLGAA